MTQRLQGIRVLITRAREQAPELARLLEAEGAEAISIPAIEIVPPQSWGPLDKALKKIPAYDWLILTSVNGVRALERRMKEAEVDVGLLRSLKVAAIGPATAAVCEKLGLKVAVVPEEYVAESVVAALRASISGKRVLLVRAKEARDVIPKELRAAGAEVDVAEAYETILPKNSAAKLHELLNDPARRPHVITFTSSSTARNFVAMLGKGKSPRERLKGIKLASIGPVTSETLRGVGLWVDVEAKEFTMAGLVDALAETQKPGK